MWAIPTGTFFFSRFLNCLRLPFFAPASAPAPAAAGFAILSSQSSVADRQLIWDGECCVAATNARIPGDWLLASGDYVFAAAFFLLATVPLRGPLRVRALVCVRWPRTGKLRRCRWPR